MPLHTPQLCPECGTPLTSTDYCSHCETQRDGVQPSALESSQNGSASGARAEPERRGRAAVATIAGGAGVTAVLGGAALVRRRRLSRRRGLLGFLR